MKVLKGGMMSLDTLSAISPVDGRYRKATAPLAEYFSEEALIRYRVMVEIEYFIALCRLSLTQLKEVDEKLYDSLQEVYRRFTRSDAEKVKSIEKTTNHDVKAVEYFLKERFNQLGLGDYQEFIHFGLTSQDVTNTALPLMIKGAWENVIQPVLDETIEQMTNLAHQWKDVAMLARTHGQPASPTLLGKEIAVFIRRLEKQCTLLAQVPYTAKFGGATGNFNAHVAAYPDIDWPAFADHLVNEVLGLTRTPVTTQIEPYDHLAAFCDGVKRINTILIDFCRDIWSYISFNYFKQKIVANEVGSSTMPHKINPIDFENAEGNLGLANAVFSHLAAKLPISRLQRDLTDSTVSRNVGVPLAHTLIALKSVQRGLGKLVLNEEIIRTDLHKNWAVVAEGIQTILRRERYPQPYEALKSLTRTHGVIDARRIADFIETLDVSDAVKAELLKITPESYTGVSVID
jgi:adenylosuccinate lyase